MAVRQAVSDISIPVEERLARRLERLSHPEEEEDLPPTENAKRACSNLLAEVAVQLPPELPFPFPHVSTAGEGDLYCEWRTGPGAVTALIAPSGVTGIYQLSMEDGRLRTLSAASPATAADLVTALVWLKAQQAAA